MYLLHVYIYIYIYKYMSPPIDAGVQKGTLSYVRVGGRRRPLELPRTEVGRRLGLRLALGLALAAYAGPARHHFAMHMLFSKSHTRNNSMTWNYVKRFLLMLRRISFNSKEMSFNSKGIPCNSEEISFHSEGIPFNSKEIPFNSKEISFNS